MRRYIRHSSISLSLMLLLTLPVAVQAQFNYTTNNGTITITGYTGTNNVVVIPSTINGLPVTSIGLGAFYACTSLSSVTIPNSVTSIESGAFRGCTRLASVMIPKSITNIAENAFGGCTSLTAIPVDALYPIYRSIDGVLFNKSETTIIQCPGGKAGTYTIPNSVTNIGSSAFDECANLINVMIPNSVTSIGQNAFLGSGLTRVTIPDSVTSLGDEAFSRCTSLTGVTIGNSVTSLGDEAFYDCESLTNVTIPSSVSSLGGSAFLYCPSLTGVYFKGNATTFSTDSSVLDFDDKATVYYLSGTTGWGPTFDGRPTALWTQVPIIQTSPPTQTAETTSAVGLRVKASSPLPLFYFWYLNATNLLSSGTNWQLDLTNVRLDQSGAYTVVISNVLGAVTSSPAMLQVIAAVERTSVPGVKVMGQTGSLLNVDYANSLNPAPNWAALGSISLTSTSGYCFDPTLPLPAQRFYRAWQTGTPSVVPSLSLPGMIAAITLTGTIGHSVRLDYINQFGPTDAWVTLDTVTLTNTSQLYFDVSATGQPQRLYRFVQVP